MSYLSFIKNLPEKLTQPPLIAALASVGIHGVLAMSLPSLSASSKPEDTKPRGTVKVVELTPAEQSRIPQLAPPPLTLPPVPNQTQLLPPLPPPSSVLPPIPNSPPYKFPLNSTRRSSTGAGLPDIFQRSSDRRQRRARQNPFNTNNTNNPDFTVGRLPDPPKVPQSGSRKVTQQEIRRRLFQGLPAGVQPGQDDISRFYPPPPPDSQQQTPFNSSEASSGEQTPIDFGQQTPSNTKPQRSVDFGQQTPNNSEQQIAANSGQQTPNNSEQQTPANSGQQTPPLSPQQIAAARRELQRQQVLADIRQQRRNYAYDGNGTRDDDYRQKLAGWGSRLNKVPSKEQEITLTPKYRACFIKKPEATALVGAQVDAKGNVTTELLRSSGYNILNEKAKEVVKAHSFGAKEQVYVVQVKFAYNEKDCPSVTTSQESRNSQSSQESKKPRDSQEAQEAQESKKPRNSQESSESKKPPDSQESSESKKPRDSQEAQESRNSQSSQDPKKPRDSQEAQESRNSQSSQDPKKPRESQESSESKKPQDSQNSQNSPEPRKPQESPDSQNSQETP